MGAQTPDQMNRPELEKRLRSVTGALLQEKGFISFPDLFLLLGYIDRKDLEDWRFRRVPYLEQVIRTNLARISFVMKTVRHDSLNGNLRPSRTGYLSWGKGPKQPLRFSKSGLPPIEELWATHFVAQHDACKPPQTVADE